MMEFLDSEHFSGYHFNISEISLSCDFQCTIPYDSILSLTEDYASSDCAAKATEDSGRAEISDPSRITRKPVPRYQC